MKFCKDCRHLKHEEKINFDHFPSFKYSIPVCNSHNILPDLVTAMTRTIDAYLARQSADYCTISGKWFEPRENKNGK